jgi:hypothetical protein
VTLGTEFAHALAAKDFDRVRALLDDGVEFRGMTPSRMWEPAGADEVITGVLQQWLEDSDEVESLDGVETDSFADTQRVGYRFTVRNPDGRFVVEQQAYLREHDGRIAWMRVMCSGFRPLG